MKKTLNQTLHLTRAKFDELKLRATALALELFLDGEATSDELHEVKAACFGLKTNPSGLFWKLFLGQAEVLSPTKG